MEIIFSVLLFLFVVCCVLSVVLVCCLLLRLATPSYIRLQHNTYEGIGIYDRTEEHCLPRKLLLTLISKSSNTHTRIFMQSIVPRYAQSVFLAKNTFCFAPKSVFSFFVFKGVLTRDEYTYILFSRFLAEDTNTSIRRYNRKVSSVC